MINRNRFKSSIFIISVICFGLLSRSSIVTNLVPIAVGDFLYVMTAYLFIAILAPHTTSSHLTMITLAFCYTVELSQLIQSDWMNAIRNIKYAKLLLGSGFLWSDMFAYTLAVISCYALEKNLHSQ